MAVQIPSRPTRQWSPWSDFGDFERAMNRVFGDLYPTRTEYPPVNIWTGKDDAVLTAELPGVELGDLDISVHENTLLLRCAAKEQEQKEKESEAYHRHECIHPSFSRSWRLPFEVDGDKAEAKLRSGILRITLPRSEASKPKKIQIKAT
jgi:HSP20 family protein